MASTDMVDQMLASVSGLEDVGYDEIGELDDREIGAKVKRAMRAKASGGGLSAAIARGVQKPASPMFARSSRDTLRRASGGFTSFALAATIGATNTQSMKVSRVVSIDRLLIVPSGPGLVIDSIKVGDEEQLLTAGVPVELYGVSALTDAQNDNFSPLGSGIDLTITLRNTTAGALTATAGIKGGVER